MKTRILILLSFVLFLSNCGEEEKKNALDGLWTSSRGSGGSTTCDGTTQTGITPFVSLRFTSSEKALILTGINGTGTTACVATFTLADAVFSEGNFSYTRPGAATLCTDIDGNTVASCDIGGASCDPNSADAAVTSSGAYSSSETELILTTTSEGNSFCTAGQMEVVTYAKQ